MTIMSGPYQRGYDEAIADVVTVVYFFWTFGKLNSGEMFKSWPRRLKLIGWVLSGVVFYLVFSYVLVPALRIMTDMFAGD